MEENIPIEFTEDEKKAIRSYYEQWTDPKISVFGRNSGLEPHQLAILHVEKLLIIQVYQGVMLLECRRCRDQLIFYVANAEEDTWSCPACDRNKMLRAFPQDTPTAVQHTIAA